MSTLAFSKTNIVVPYSLANLLVTVPALYDFSKYGPVSSSSFSLSCVSSVNYSDPTCALNVALGPPVAPNTCSAGCVAGGGLTYDPGNHTLADFCLHDATSPAISCASTEISGVFQIICACE